MVPWPRCLVDAALLVVRCGLILVAVLTFPRIAMADALPSPTPTQTPFSTPPAASSSPAPAVNLSSAIAQSGAAVTVAGTGFNPGEAIVVFLDSPDHALAPAVADGSGSFDVTVSLNGVAPGNHMVCAQHQPQPRCVQLVVAAPAPTPSSTLRPTPAPAPTATANLVPVAPPSGATGTIAPSPTTSPAPAEALPVQSAAGVTDVSSNPGGIALLLVAVVLIALSAAFVLVRRRAAVATTPAPVAPAHPRILISYRPADSAAEADRLRDELGARFGPEQVLMDVRRVEPGLDFTEAVDRAVDESAAVIAVIGRGWLANVDDPDDHVRYEVATALSKGRRVFPLLVQGAGLPGGSQLPDALRPLARRVPFALDATAGIDDLIRALDHAFARNQSDAVAAGVPASRSDHAKAEENEKKRWTLGDLVPWIGAATAVVTAATGVYTFATRPDPAVGSYQTQVIATCNRVDDTLSAGHGLDVVYPAPPSFAIHKAGLERLWRQNLAYVRNEFALLDALKAPDSLKEKRIRAIAAQQALYAVWQADLQFIDANVLDGESVDEFNVQFANRTSADSAAVAQVSARMSELANGECRLIGSPARTAPTQ